MQTHFSINTGSGGAGSHAGTGGHGGDVYLTHNNYGPESLGTALLLSLPRALSAAYDSGREDAPSSCLHGTRVAVLKDIQLWSESPNRETPPVYWLSGLAGIGKSTIAKTVAERARANTALGASFFFSRADNPLRNPRLVFPTLAFQLAQSDTEFKEVIVEALTQDPALGHKELLPQLQELILTPLLRIDPHHSPTLMILDALDECDEQGAADILRLIFSHAIRIPFLRILITCRPQPHLSSVFNKVPNLAKTVLHDIEASVVQEDISLYISTQLAKIPEKLDLDIPTDWATEVERNLLLEKSGKLFIYAATAIRFIGDNRMRHPHRQLKLILNTRSAQEAGAVPYLQLDELYMGVLRNTLSGSNRPEILERFQIVIGSIVLLREPLPLDSLTEFVQCERSAVEAALYHLHSVIVPPSNIHEAPRIYHPSFLEFITDSSRCTMKEFVIVPIPEQELRHANRCFKIMARHLKRNVAGISDSSFLNREVHEFERKVREALPPEAQYVCRYWASHLSYVEPGEKRMVEAVEEFTMQSILWWFEAMSLIGSVSTAISSIQTAHQWAISSKCKAIVIEILSDAYRFILAHGEVIRESALHVYHSALPFTPHNTALYKVYHEGAKDCIRVLQGMESEWPQSLSTLAGHSGAITTVAFSPNGLLVASGSLDHSLRLWDAMSGALIVTLKGHSGPVEGVVFSPDGSCLASGSLDHSLWLWDAISGEPIARLDGHSRAVSTVAFSPTGLCVASGSYDSSVRLWDAISGVPTAILEGHSDMVETIAFSPDGLRLASGSYDHNLWLWDPVSGAAIVKMEGHSQLVRVVIFSPDGVHLASGSNDSTIWLWNATAGTPIAKLEGHSEYIRAIAFSPDGLHLASGTSGDTGSLRLWDAISGAPIMILEGHSVGVATISFSPNGLFLASGSFDATVRLWDATSGACIVKFEGHSLHVTTIAFSPDGLHLVSGSMDQTLQLWDTMSGVPIARLRGHSEAVRTIAFSPNGLCLASGSDDHTLWLWNAMSGMPIAKLEGHSELVGTLAFSPDGLCLASGSNDKTVWLWDVTSGTCIVKLELEGHSELVTAIAFSPDGLHLASGSANGILWLWDTMSGVLIAKLEGHYKRSRVNTIAFSPDGLCMASGSSDKTICLWDAMSGMPIAKLDGHSNRVTEVAFSLDSCTLISRTAVETFTWDLTSQPPCHLLSGSSAEASAPFVGSTPLIWSITNQWIQVERREDGHSKRICYVPPHYSWIPVLASSQRAHSRIAIGCGDGRVVILAIPRDPFKWRFSEEGTYTGLEPITVTEQSSLTDQHNDNIGQNRPRDFRKLLRRLKVTFLCC